MARRPPAMRVRLLGPLEVSVGNSPIVVDTRKALAIVALLAAEGRPFARDELAAMLWPDSDDEAARGALRRTLSTLRAGVDGAGLGIDRSTVWLDASVNVDLTDLERLARSTETGDLVRAADLARGPFLPGFSLRDSPEFDDWRAARQTAVERTVASLLDQLAIAREAAGDLPGAIEAAGRRLDLDPLDEGGHVRLMDLYAAGGDRAGAIRQYRACVTVLDRELGVAPLASTTARYEAIRDADVAVAPTPAARLVGSTPIAVDLPPARPMLPLVGREPVVRRAAAAHDRATAGHGSIVVLSGEAGIGKTAVGSAVADLVRSRGGTVLAARAYPGEAGIAYGPIVEILRGVAASARLDALDPATRSELGRLLPALDPARRATETRAPGAHARLVAAIADGLTAIADGPVAGLVWLDDVQWADEATRESVAYLARRLDDRRLVVVLAWRPEDLDSAGEAFASRILDAPGTTVEALDRLDRSAIAELVEASGSPPGTPTDEAIDRLLAASEGLPLYVVEALASGVEAVDGSMPQGVRAVLRGRLSGVGETAGQVLTAASVIGRSFDVETVRQASGRSDEETADAIDELLARGLIREDGVRYDFAHGGLRDLTYEAASLARRRLLHRRVADALRADLARSGRDDLARLALIASHEQEAGRDAEAAEAYGLAGTRAAAVFANREAIAHDEAALALGHPDATGLHAEIGRLRTRLGEYAAAAASLEAAAALAPPPDLPALEGALARVHARRGDLVLADRHLEAGLTLGGDAGVHAGLLVDRAVIRRRAGDIDGAAEAATLAKAAALVAHDATTAGAADRMLGLLALDRGATGEARAALERALEAADADPDPTARIAARTGLAMTAAAAGDLDTGLAQGQAAVDDCRRVGDRHLEAAVENHLADMLHAAGRDDEAMTHLGRAVAAFAEVGGDPADPDPGIWMLSAL